MTTLTGTRPPVANSPRFIGIGDEPVYSITFHQKRLGRLIVHGVMGRVRRVTICAVDFIGVDDPYIDAPINCLTCLANLGDHYRAR